MEILYGTKHKLALRKSNSTAFVTVDAVSEGTLNEVGDTTKQREIVDSVSAQIVKKILADCREPSNDSYTRHGEHRK